MGRYFPTCLFHKPIDLFFNIILPVPSINCNLLTNMCGVIRVILFHAKHAIAESTASLFEHDISTLERLDPVHDEPQDYCKLASFKLVKNGTRTLNNSRLGNSDYFCILGVWPQRSWASVVMFFEALSDIGRAAETTRKNQICLRRD